MQQEILDIYSKNFDRAEIIYKKLNKKYTLKQIKDVLKNIDTNQIIGKKQENKDLQIPISAPTGSFQADLTLYKQFKRQNHGYSAILTIIEINTRFAYVYPLKDKKAETILKCIEDLYSKEGSNLRSISFDAGSEFDNNILKRYLETNKIEYIIFNKQTQPNATMLIERFNRTLRDKISKFQSFYKQKNYVDNLDKIVSEYNNTEHSAIKMSPAEAKKQHFSNNEVRQQKFDTIQKIEQQFKIGDYVRILRDKKLFEKGQKNYTKNIYKIVDKKDLNFVLQKIKEGKPEGDQIIKTAQSLIKINFADLIQNQPTKKEVSKKQVKKVTNLEKKLRKEGINLQNIIDHEKFLQDNDIPNVQQEQKPVKVDQFIIGEQLARENKLKEVKKQNEYLQKQNILQRSKSNENLQEYKQKLDEQDQEMMQLQQIMQDLEEEKKRLMEQVQKNGVMSIDDKIKQLQMQEEQIKNQIHWLNLAKHNRTIQSREKHVLKMRENKEINEMFEQGSEIHKFLNKSEYYINRTQNKLEAEKYDILVKQINNKYDEQKKQIKQQIEELKQKQQDEEKLSQKQKEAKQLGKQIEEIQIEIINLDDEQFVNNQSNQEQIQSQIEEYKKQQKFLLEKYKELTGKEYQFKEIQELDVENKEEQKQENKKEQKQETLHDKFNNFGKLNQIFFTIMIITMSPSKYRQKLLQSDEKLSVILLIPLLIGLSVKAFPMGLVIEPKASPTESATFSKIFLLSSLSYSHFILSQFSRYLYSPLAFFLSAFSLSRLYLQISKSVILLKSIFSK